MIYRREIDGLRALAILPVILFHAGFSAFQGGYIGVDIFFVISGYLITSILLAERASGNFSFLKFYERRARRILPALFLVMFCSLLAAWAMLWTSDIKRFSASLKYVSFFVGNLFFSNAGDYFGPSLDLMPLLHTWSLAVEEQYYIIFPVLLFFLWRFFGDKISVPLLLILVVSLLVAQFRVLGGFEATFYLLPSRAWEILLGAVTAAAMWQNETNKRSPGAGRLFGYDTLAITGLVLIVFSVLYFDRQTPHPGFATLVPTIGAVLIIRFGDSQTVVGKLLSSAPLVGIGLVSYSAYLWHQPLFAFAKHLSIAEPGDLRFGLLALLAILLACISWKYVEAPFRKKGRFSPKFVLGFSVVGVLFFSVAGFLGEKRSDVINSMLPYRQAMHSLESKIRPNYGLNGKCNTFNISDKCRTSDAPEMLVWGDSYAMHLIDGILSSNEGAAIAQMTMPACAPVIGVSYLLRDKSHEESFASACIDFNNQVLHWLSENPSVKHVVLASQYFHFFESDAELYDGRNLNRFDRAVLLSKFRETLKRIKELGASPVLVAPPPASGENIGKCLAKRKLKNDDLSLCDFKETEILPVATQVYDFLGDLSRDYKVLWLNRAMCVRGACKTHEGDVFFYNGVGHLSVEGSALIGRDLDFYRFFTKP